jgi:hypothetical protein
LHFLALPIVFSQFPLTVVAVTFLPPVSIFPIKLLSTSVISHFLIFESLIVSLPTLPSIAEIFPAVLQPQVPLAFASPRAQLIFNDFQQPTCLLITSSIFHSPHPAFSSIL